MSKHLIIAMAAAATLSGAFAVSTAQAADRGVCEDYARAAVRQFHDAQEHRRCHEFIRSNPSRWHGDFRAHFDWCRANRWEEVARERDARTDALRSCAHD